MTEQLHLDLTPGDHPLAVIHPDTRFPTGSGHGNFAVTTPGPHPADGAWCDLGTELHWWAHTSIRLNRQAARDLAAALTAWADRPDHTEPR